MRKCLLAILFLGLLAMPLPAQDHPRFEVFGGYQYLHLGGGNSNGLGTGEGFNGWNASVTGNITNHFGIEGNFGGAYDTISSIDFKMYTYSGGPVVFSESGRLKPFAHVLFGGVHLTGSTSFVVDSIQSQANSASISWNGYTIMAGGGLDVKVNRAIAVRLAQFDWVYYNLSDTSFSGTPVPGFSASNNVRLASGIVVRF
ncbi:MAG TPA: outer membrane beta-barrel protein [Terriglobales bacterium]|nr:outer membrane beta-barrel protein [Terriglobales bacterium]